MARGLKPSRPSKSAFQQGDDAEAAARADVPLFSLRGLQVHRKKIFALFAVASLVFLVAGLALINLTSAANLDVSAANPFERAKAGEQVNFTVTVRNSAQLATFAYELHVLGLPPNWTAIAGEEAFPLAAGASREVRVTIATGPSSPPQHDFPVVVKAIAKTGDLRTTLASRSTTVTVRVIASDLTLAFETRSTPNAFQGGAAAHNSSWSACGSAPGPSFDLPAGANVTSASFAVSYAAADPNATGNLSADVGDDGTADGEVALAPGSLRLSLLASAFANYSAAHAGATSPLQVPLRLSSCMNATAWTLNLTAPLVNLLRPVAPGERLPVDVLDPNSATGQTRLVGRVTSRESRPLSVVLGIPTLPNGWETVPVLSSSPIPLAPMSSNTLEFSLHVAKTVPVGSLPVNFTACVQVNANDCVQASASLEMPEAPFFTVETYVQPVPLKELNRGRSVDTLLVAQNRGNQPTGFEVELAPRTGLNYTFFNGSGNLSLGTAIDLPVSGLYLFALRVRAEPAAATSHYTVSPTFRNASAHIVQTGVRLTLAVTDAPAAPESLALGAKALVEFAGVTDDGLLFDTNIFSLLPLVDQKTRPTHPEYERPSAGGVTPYEFRLERFEDYTNEIHKGFESFLEGMRERETVVLWLAPSQTQLPQNAVLKDRTLVFEVKLTALPAG